MGSCTIIESSHMFSVARGNPATATCCDETMWICLSNLSICISWMINRRIRIDME